MKILQNVSKISILAVGLTLGLASNSNAAALQGRVGINPLNQGGLAAGVNLIGTGVTGPDGNPLTDFDFVPPEDGNPLVNGGTTGAVIELNANPVNTSNPTSPNDFEPFVAEEGTIQDLTLAETQAVNSGAPLEEFILVPGAFSFQLEQVNFPQYTSDSSGTTISVGVEGTFFNLSDGSNDASSGVGTFSVDFAGLNPDEVRELFDEPGELSEQFSPTTYSSNFVTIAPTPDTATTPEPGSILSLLAVGLIGSGSVFKRKSDSHS